MDIQEKVALVTGGAMGIGKSIALSLAAEGAAVVVDDIDDDAGHETVREIEEAGGRAAFVRADVSKDEDVQSMIAFAEKTCGGLDILVNNAGITTGRQTFPEMEPERWMRVLDVNLRGVILGTQYGIEAMRRRGGGAIVNVASMAAIGYGASPMPVYAASKAGIVRFTTALAPLKESMNIRVNCVCPDVVDTPMTRRTREEAPERWAQFARLDLLQPEDIAEAVLDFVRDDSLAGRVMYSLCGMPRRLMPELEGLVWSASPERLDVLGWHELRSYFAKPGQ